MVREVPQVQVDNDGVRVTRWTLAGAREPGSWRC